MPAKRKTTPSGWTSFNAPCCIHNGDSADKRQRGGLITNPDGGVSYHCFNCGFKTSWRNGRNLSFKMKKFMRWLNVPDDTITKLALQVLQTKTDETGHKTFITLPKFVSKELPAKSKPIHEWADYKALEPGGIDKDLFKVLEYIASRKLNAAIKAEDDLGIEDSGPGEESEIQDNVPNSPLETSKAASVGDNPLDSGLPEQQEALADEDNTRTKVMSMMEDTIRTKVMSMMEFSENRLTSGNRDILRICKVCGKEGAGNAIKDHIESNHIEGINIACNLCDKTFRSRNSLAEHRYRCHKRSPATHSDMF